MMKKVVFTGSAVAIVTPFHETGVDYDRLGELIEFQISNQTDGIVICGTTGESSTMPDEEHLAAIEYTVKKVNGRIPVIAGTGSNDTEHGIKLCQAAERVGVDALLLVTPYYNKCTQKGLIAHYKALAGSVNLPVILYNVPSRTGVTIKPETALELSKVENIVAIKEASGSLTETLKIARLCGENLHIYSGNDDIIVPMLAAGAKGVISVVANILPKDTHRICELYQTGKTEEALQLQLKMLDLINALFVEVNPIPVKTALNLMGFDVGKLRLPLCDMEEKNLEMLKTQMKNYGITIKE